jgi:signal transduction histidine kinase
VDIQPATLEFKPDFFCISNTRWEQAQRESVQTRSINQQLSLTLLALGHDLRQDLHLLKAWLSLPSEAPILGTCGGADHVSALIHRLTRKCEQAAALASMNTPCGKPASKTLVAIQPLLLDAYTQWHPEAESKGLKFKLRSPNVMVSTNAFWLGVIVSNLIGNAVQHTATGGVAVELSGGLNDWVLSVLDSGPGFVTPASEPQNLEVRSPWTRSTGLGIGLSLVKQAAALLGHTLTIESTPSGSIVRLHIPHGSEPVDVSSDPP